MKSKFYTHFSLRRICRIFCLFYCQDLRGKVPVKREYPFRLTLCVAFPFSFRFSRSISGSGSLSRQTRIDCIIAYSAANALGHRSELERRKIRKGRHFEVNRSTFLNNCMLKRENVLPRVPYALLSRLLVNMKKSYSCIHAATKTIGSSQTGGES